MIEIERKFKLTNKQRASIEKDLQKRYGTPKRIHQIDEVFLQGIDSFKDFTRGMPVIRLRTENGAVQLTCKHMINEAGDMAEYELDISSGEIMRCILTEMDCRPVTTVDKVRFETKTSEVTFCIDEVKGLGNFIEIEVLAEDKSNLKDIERQIMTTASSYGLTDKDIESKKYDILVTQ
jgi:adenylate cyclase class 2